MLELSLFGTAKLNVFGGLSIKLQHFNTQKT